MVCDTYLIAYWVDVECVKQTKNEREREMYKYLYSLVARTNKVTYKRENIFYSWSEAKKVKCEHSSCAECYA